jgi:hypothetical protein
MKQGFLPAANAINRFLMSVRILLGGALLFSLIACSNGSGSSGPDPSDPSGSSGKSSSNSSSTSSSSSGSSSSSSGGDPALKDVIWIERVNVSVSGTTLVKTGGCDGCLDAGASSRQHMAAGNGYFEFTVSETNKVRYIGLNTSSTTPYPQDILFGLKQVSGRAEVKEAGKYRADIAISTGDVMRIEVSSGVITYAKNGVVFYTSTTTENLPLYVDSALINMGATLTNARMTVDPDDDSSGSGSRSISAKSTNTENVSWTDLINVTASATSLQKTGGCDGCADAAALSQQLVTSGDALISISWFPKPGRCSTLA